MKGIKSTELVAQKEFGNETFSVLNFKKNIYTSPNQGFSLQLDNFIKALFAQLFSI